MRSLQAVDEMVGGIVARLRGSGRLDDTYIVFASDNGWLYGEHRLKGKGLPYEEAVRMPLYVRGPGVVPGAVLDNLVGNADLAPTFAEWAGVPPPAGFDGRSFRCCCAPGRQGRRRGGRPTRWGSTRATTARASAAGLARRADAALHLRRVRDHGGAGAVRRHGGPEPAP